MYNDINQLPGRDGNLKQEGLIEDAPIFSLDLSDEEVIAQINKAVSDAEGFWNSELRLDDRRKKNRDYWKGKQLNDDEFYNHEVPYVENRIMVDVETLVSAINSKSAEPVIYPARDNENSKILARTFQDYIKNFSDREGIKFEFRTATRHVLLDYIGILKYRFDKFEGRHGDIVVEAVNPGKIVFDKNTPLGGNPRFVCEYMEDTLEDLSHMFPNKKDELWGKLGIRRGVTSQLNKLIGYKEIWFTFYDEEEESKKEAVAWVYRDLVLDKQLNPNFNYDDEEIELATGEKVKVFKNFLPHPVKPYVCINHLNLGDYLIDDTSLVEQARKPQDVLNKRGRQIVENADQANSGLVVSSDFATQEDVEMLTGAPDEKLVGNGDVRAGVGRMPPPLLPNYVIEDKLDARKIIDNIFGTHEPTRGEASGAETLGQDILARQGDFTRIGYLVESIEQAAQQLYMGLAQMFKVFYTREHWVRAQGENGLITFYKLQQDMIEDGMEIIVKPGTTLPTDKVTRRAEAIELAQINRIDPITLYERLEWPDPVKSAYRLFLMGAAPQELFGSEFKVQADERAQSHILLLNNREIPPLPTPIRPEYVKTLREYIQGAEYGQLPVEVKRLHIEFMRKITNQIQIQTGQKPPAVEQVAEPGQPAQQQMGFPELERRTIRKPIGREQSALQTLVGRGGL